MALPCSQSLRKGKDAPPAFLNNTFEGEPGQIMKRAARNSPPLSMHTINYRRRGEPQAGWQCLLLSIA